MWNDLKYYRQALGIHMLWNSYPIIFFFRDGLRIGPSGSVFTMIFWVIGFLLIFPKNIFSTIYFPNRVLSFFWLGFIAVAWVYWQYYPGINGSPTGSKEMLTYVLPIAFFLLMCYYPNDKTDILLKSLILYTLFASIGLLYVILNDPTWHIGERAGIRYAANTAQSNPHTYANNALMTIVASMIMVQRTNSFLYKLVYLFLVFFSVVVMILCRTNTSIITLVVITFVAFMFNSIKVVKALFSKNTLKIVGGIAIIISLSLSQLTFVTTAVTSNYQAFSSRFGRVIYTITGVQTSEPTAGEGGIDHSSLYRVLSWKYATDFFFNQASIGTIIFGEGYKSQFFDVPSLEAWVNLGILGFIFYNGFWFLLGMTNLLQYSYPTNPASTFIAYFSLLLFVALASGGQTIDISAWLTQAFFIRFSGLKSSKPVLALSQT
ncbi:hypothetical protein P1X15_15225 [Runella sp. MFBS21]|uniref:hypothetical protein n=1 Tax=Runella sp. MFBS21 TaxID=3034018 RepID=UPI0023F7B693|nr:hypothetical protein [Runella sp. MFBS21]MDF7818967.1 hypothetical protein [Runella sp. MFBS21]